MGCFFTQSQCMKIGKSNNRFEKGKMREAPRDLEGDKISSSDALIVIF